MDNEIKQGAFKAIKEINKQTEQFQLGEFEELMLDSIHFELFNKELKDRIEQCQNLCALTLNDCNLKSLSNFPSLPKLIKLELIDNKLQGELLNELPSFPELTSLCLGGNQISRFDEIKTLIKYENLAELDFIGCGVTSIDNYREVMFREFPNLMILDGCDKEGNIVDLNEDEEDQDDFSDDMRDDEDQLDSEFNDDDDDDQMMDSDEMEEQEFLHKKIKK